jgi:hypothetical protein
VSDLGRGLFSFEFPAQIETSASREHRIALEKQHITLHKIRVLHPQITDKIKHEI